MNLELVLGTAPSSGGGAIITAEELKAQCRYEGTDEDALVTRLLTAATNWVQNWTRRQYINATWVGYLHQFPWNVGHIIVPKPPLSSVTSIAYLDENGDSQTLATTVYEAVTAQLPGRIVLKPDQDWPVTQTDKYHAVTVTFVAGYGTAISSVPEEVRHAALMLATYWFDNRGAVVIGTTDKEMELAVKSLLGPVQRPFVG